MSSVDVVIPCYNYARYLEFCVGTILSQRDVDVRVLIVDDKSTDDTPAICAKLAAADPRVSFVRNEVNLGLIGTANRGIMDWASAEYYTLISADDALSPGALARATQVLDAYPDVGFVLGRALVITDDVTPAIPADTINARCQILSGRAFLQRNFDSGNPAPSPAVVLRTKLQHKLGGYHSAMRHTSDMEMWMRFALHGNVGVIRDVQSLYRWHGSNMTLQFDAIKDRRERLATIAVVAENGGAEAPGFAEGVHAMKRRFAREAYWEAGEAFERGDEKVCAEGIAFAEALDPAIRNAPIAWRFRAKKLMGRSVARLARGAFVKAKRAVGGEPERPWFQIHTQLGWWPDPSELIEQPLFKGEIAPGQKPSAPAPQLSFVICTRNRVSMMPGCLDSLLAATRAAPDVSVEIVVVDNGSTDGTAAAVEQWASANAIPVRVVPEPRAGLSIARNAGFSAARGDILVFTDDDCRVAPDYIAHLIRAHAAYSGPAIIGGRVELGDARDLPMTIKTDKEAAVFDGVDAGAFVIGSNLTLNRAAWTKVGLMDERLGAGTPLHASEETDYIHRAYLAGVPILYAPELCVYHFHGRRTAPEIKKLWRGYSIGNGALFAKYFGTPFMRQFRWNLKNALKEALNRTQLRPDMGMTYRAMVLGNIEGMALYWWGSLRGRGTRKS